MLLLCALLFVVTLGSAIFYRGLWKSTVYSVAYGRGVETFSDGLLFRPIDIRVADRLMSGLYCVKLPQLDPRWLIVDFEREMFYCPNLPPDCDGLNQYYGIPVASEKMEPAWRVDFSGGRAHCVAPSGSWCSLTPHE